MYFLVAYTRLYKSLCRSVCQSVCLPHPVCFFSPKGDLTSITAPAHPYATDAVVYTALFSRMHMALYVTISLCRSIGSSVSPPIDPSVCNHLSIYVFWGCSFLFSYLDSWRIRSGGETKVSLCGVNGDDVTAENLECKNIEKIVYNVVEFCLQLHISHSISMYLCSVWMMVGVDVTLT